MKIDIELNSKIPQSIFSDLNKIQNSLDSLSKKRDISINTGELSKLSSGLNTTIDKLRNDIRSRVGKELKEAFKLDVNINDSKFDSALSRMVSKISKLEDATGKLESKLARTFSSSASGLQGFEKKLDSIVSKIERISGTNLRSGGTHYPIFLQDRSLGVLNNGVLTGEERPVDVNKYRSQGNIDRGGNTRYRSGTSDPVQNKLLQNLLEQNRQRDNELGRVLRQSLDQRINNRTSISQEVAKYIGRVSLSSNNIASLSGINSRVTGEKLLSSISETNRRKDQEEQRLRELVKQRNDFFATKSLISTGSRNVSNTDFTLQTPLLDRQAYIGPLQDKKILERQIIGLEKSKTNVERYIADLQLKFKATDKAFENKILSYTSKIDNIQKQLEQTKSLDNLLPGNPLKQTIGRLENQLKNLQNLKSLTEAKRNIVPSSIDKAQESLGYISEKFFSANLSVKSLEKLEENIKFVDDLDKGIDTVQNSINTLGKLTLEQNKQLSGLGGSIDKAKKNELKAKIRKETLEKRSAEAATTQRESDLQGSFDLLSQYKTGLEYFPELGTPEAQAARAAGLSPAQISLLSDKGRGRTDSRARVLAQRQEEEQEEQERKSLGRGGGKLDFDISRLKQPEVARQLGFALLFGGPTTLFGSAIGGALGGGTGALLGSQIAQFGRNLAAGPLEEITKSVDESKDLALSSQRAILGITAVRQANLIETGVSGRPIPTLESIRVQNRKAAEIQQTARQQLLPLGIAGATESTFIQGVTSSLAARGFAGANPNQISRIATLLGGAIQTQRPQLLDNPTILLRDVQDLLTGGPLAKRTILSQLSGVREAVPELQRAKSIEQYTAILEKFLGQFEITAKNLDNPIVNLNKLSGAIDNLKTSAGNAYLEGIQPAVKVLTETLQTDTVKAGVKDLGETVGFFAKNALLANSNLIKFATSFEENFLKPLTQATPTLASFAIGLAAIQGVSVLNGGNALKALKDNTLESATNFGAGALNLLGLTRKEKIGPNYSPLQFGEIAPENGILTRLATLAELGITPAIGGTVAAGALAGLGLFGGGALVEAQIKSREDESEKRANEALEDIIQTREQVTPFARRNQLFNKTGLTAGFEKFRQQFSIGTPQDQLGLIDKYRKDSIANKTELPLEELEFLSESGGGIREQLFKQRTQNFIPALPGQGLALLKEQLRTEFSPEAEKELTDNLAKAQADLEKAKLNGPKQFEQDKAISRANSIGLVTQKVGLLEKLIDLKSNVQITEGSSLSENYGFAPKSVLSSNEGTLSEQEFTKKIADLDRKIKEEERNFKALSPTASIDEAKNKKDQIAAKVAGFEGKKITIQSQETIAELNKTAQSTISGISTTTVAGKLESLNVQIKATEDGLKALDEATKTAKDKGASTDGLDLLKSTERLKEFNLQLEKINTQAGRFVENLAKVNTSTPTGGLIATQARLDKNTDFLANSEKKRAEIFKENIPQAEKDLKIQDLNLKQDEAFVDNIKAINDQVSGLQAKLALKVSTIDQRSPLGGYLAATERRKELDAEVDAAVRKEQKTRENIARLEKRGAPGDFQAAQSNREVLKDIVQSVQASTLNRDLSVRDQFSAYIKQLLDQNRGFDTKTFFGQERSLDIRRAANGLDLSNAQQQILKDAKASPAVLQGDFDKLSDALQENKNIERESTDVLINRRHAEEQLIDASTSLRRTLSTEDDQRKLLSYNVKEASGALKEFQDSANLRKLSATQGLYTQGQQFQTKYGAIPDNLSTEALSSLLDPRIAKGREKDILQEQINASARALEKLPGQEQNEELKLKLNTISAGDALNDFDKNIKRSTESFEELNKRLKDLLSVSPNTRQQALFSDKDVKDLNDRSNYNLPNSLIGRELIETDIKNPKIGSITAKDFGAIFNATLGFGQEEEKPKEFTKAELNSINFPLLKPNPYKPTNIAPVDDSFASPPGKEPLYPPFLPGGGVPFQFGEDYGLTPFSNLKDTGGKYTPGQTLTDFYNLSPGQLQQIKIGNLESLESGLGEIPAPLFKGAKDVLGKNLKFKVDDKLSDFNSSKIEDIGIIAETELKKKGGLLKPTGDVEFPLERSYKPEKIRGAARHEFGHIQDYILGSNENKEGYRQPFSDSLKKIFEKEKAAYVKKFPEALPTKDKIGLYALTSASEAFAELSAADFAKSKLDTGQINALKALPETNKLIKEKYKSRYGKDIFNQKGSNDFTISKYKPEIVEGVLGKASKAELEPPSPLQDFTGPYQLPRPGALHKMSIEDLLGDYEKQTNKKPDLFEPTTPTSLGKNIFGQELSGQNKDILSTLSVNNASTEKAPKNLAEALKNMEDSLASKLTDIVKLLEASGKNTPDPSTLKNLISGAVREAADSIF